MSWLVCQRRGIKDTRAYAYLAPYLENNDVIPDFSVDVVLGAVRTIEQMLDSHFKYRQFNFISILKRKLIIPKSDIADNQYKECHNLIHKNIKKFANITNSSQNTIYDIQEINNMVTTVKNILKGDKE